MTTLTERIAGLNGFVGHKPPVKAATTGNITLSGEQTIDGVSVTSGDRVLVKDQTDGTENGIWVVASGAWSRSKDFNGARDVVSGTQVLVNSGSINGARIYRITTADDITIGTTSIAFDVVDATNLRSFDTRSNITSEPVGSSVTHLRTAGYATVGDGGGALYKRVGAEPSHELKVQSADGAWWELVPEFGAINAVATGMVEGDSAANGAGNVTAFDAYIGFLQDKQAESHASRTAGYRLVFPVGIFHFNDNLNAKAAVHIVGSSGFDRSADYGTRFVFPADTHGIIIHAKDTIDDTTTTDGFEADGATVDSIAVKGGGSGETTGHGIWLRRPALIQRCYVSAFAENGVHILSNLTGGGATEGNTNTWRLYEVTAESNGGHGVFVDDADANAGTGIGVDVRSNTGWGIYDSSFLGNHWAGCHADGNTAGNYKTDNANARNVFIGCYAEQSNNEFVLPTTVIGGHKMDSVAAGNFAYYGAGTAQAKIVTVGDFDFNLGRIMAFIATHATPRIELEDGSGNKVYIVENGGLDFRTDAAINSVTFQDFGQTAGLASFTVRRATSTGGAGTVEDIASSTGTTGGSGSAGAGSQYVELNIDGTTFKVLHDGTL